MKVKGTHTVKNSVEVEISNEEVSSIIETQSFQVLTKVVQKKLLKSFIESLVPASKGNFTIHTAFQYISDSNYLLVEVDADWDYHNNVGMDRFVRVLTKEESTKYETIKNLPEWVDKLLE